MIETTATRIITIQLSETPRRRLPILALLSGNAVSLIGNQITGLQPVMRLGVGTGVTRNPTRAM